MMNDKKKEPILYKTEDGSNTLYSQELNEHYHSVHGAVQESEHIFIKYGLKHILSTTPQPSILEIGFGTGLNCLLTLRNVTNIKYTSIEKYPISAKQAIELEYAVNKEEQDLFRQLHEASWNTALKVNGTQLFKVKDDIVTCDFGMDNYDLIYFDAFSPEVQPDLWTTTIFEKMFLALRKGGVLLTYCAKGSVKRGLKSVGFSIDNPPGPPGKREITRATK
jgi:tRNA U34 5-methylaminomethyl-2-thiouridine-forming methyltransferase MnmC